jgi:hypothetical protein
MPISEVSAGDTQALRRPAGSGNRPMVSSIQRPPVSMLGEAPVQLPPLPEGVEELKFADFYKMPVGPRGLEMTERLKQLEGAKVRLSGYFVFEDWSSCSCPPTSADAASNRRPAMPAWMKHVVPGRAIFCPLPTSVNLDHYGLGDELPSQMAFLTIAPRFGQPVFFRPGFFTAIGVLELGNKAEPDGRVSHVRLKVENEADIAPVGLATPSSPSTEAAAGPAAAVITPSANP